MSPRHDPAHSSSRSVRQPQRGFTLVELLVAFVIMALSLALLYRVMGGSARNAADMRERQAATLQLQALLGSKDSLTAEGWNDSGRSGNLRWAVFSQPYAQPESQAQRELPLHEVQLTVEWGDGTSRRQVQATTLLPQRKAPPGARIP